MPNFAEKQMYKLMGIDSKLQLQEWTVRHVQARKTLMKIIEHFEHNGILTKEDFEVMAEETFNQIKEDSLKVAETAKGMKV